MEECLMRLNIGFVGAEPLEPTFEQVQLAESCGLDGVSSSEHLGLHDAIVPSALYLRMTRRLEVNLLGLCAASRHPALTAMELASLAELGPGRIRAQVGTGAPTMLRQICADMSDPIPRVRSLVKTLRRLLSGEELDGSLPAGEFNGFGLRSFDGSGLVSYAGPAIPIDVMAIRPHMLRLAAQIGDGVVLTGGSSVEYLSDAVRSVETELAAAGRQREDFRITALTFGVIAPDFQDHLLPLRLVLATYAPELVVHTMRGALDSALYADALAKDGPLAAQSFFTPEAVGQLTVAASGPEDLAPVLSRYAGTGIDVLDIHLVGPTETRAHAIESIAAARSRISTSLTAT